MFDDPAFKIYALSSAIVALHLFTLAAITGAVRTKHKSFTNPEDAALSKVKESEADHPSVQRVKRAHQNLIESAIPFFAVGILYAMTKPSQVAAQAYFFTFVGARVLHTIFYMLGKQPFRTMSFALGAFAVIGMAVHVIRHAI